MKHFFDPRSYAVPLSFSVCSLGGCLVLLAKNAQYAELAQSLIAIPGDFKVFVLLSCVIAFGLMEFFVYLLTDCICYLWYLYDVRKARKTMEDAA